MCRKILLIFTKYNLFIEKANYMLKMQIEYQESTYQIERKRRSNITMLQIKDICNAYQIEK